MVTLRKEVNQIERPSTSKDSKRVEEIPVAPSRADGETGTAYKPQNHRKVLCVFARYSPCFATFHHSYQFFSDVVAFMPPQGILTVAAYLPKSWEVRVVDENVTPMTSEDLDWCDAVFASGMHIQRDHINDIQRRAHERGKICALGGPSVSACPEYYTAFDLLHVGELGDATDELIEYIDLHTERPEEQIQFHTKLRVAINDFPIPAYHKIDINKYMVLNIQWSSGCPYRCEFCDIPELYGRNPRMKTPERLIRELETLLAQEPIGAVYFVDDNFIGNRKAAKELLHALIDWQKKTGYRLRMSGECTINVAKDTEMLELMREAYFTDMFFGIETPKPDTTKNIDKQHNMRMPVLDALKIVNSYGIEPHIGIIFGFDGDGEDTAELVTEFIDQANSPLVAINVLYALPKTPLWRRLEREGRLIPNAEADETNIEFEMPNEVVIEQWRKAVDAIYSPKALYKRYRYNIEHTYPNRLMVKPHLSPRLIKFGLNAMARIFARVGMQAHYKQEFWKMSAELIRSGHIDHLVYIAAMAHHLIKYRDEVNEGKIKASNFSHRSFDRSDLDRKSLGQRVRRRVGKATERVRARLGV